MGETCRVQELVTVSKANLEGLEDALVDALRERDTLRGEVAALREALVALRHARDLEIETSQSWRTDRAWREGWAKVDAALAAVPADARAQQEEA